MLEYLLGIASIITAALDFMDRQHKIKNRIEVDATVIKAKENNLLLDPGFYNFVFQYSIDEEEYETSIRIQGSKYKRGDVVRIYCYNKNYNTIILPDRIRRSAFGDLCGAICGIVLIYFQMFH